jgi:hypothetical protein
LSFKNLFSLILCVGMSFHVLAEGNSLLSDLGDDSQEAKAPAKNTKQVATSDSSPVTGDAFQRYFVSRSRQENLSIDVRQWVELIREGKVAQAAHLWTSIQTQIPDDFRHEAKAAQLYCLWRLSLDQTFFEQWTLALADPGYMKSAAELTFEQLSTVNLDAWLLNADVVINTKEQTILDRIPASRSFVLTLKAWAQLRSDKHAEEMLAKLPSDSKLIPWLAETAIFEHVKHNDLKGAARVIKNYVDPYLSTTRDLDLLARMDLASARILYQAGQLKFAADYYRKIPNQSNSYLIAQEELAWVYLRLNDMVHMRGEVEAFFTPSLRDRFEPEAYVLRSISDLKMCFYDKLDKDLADFTKSNAVWAKSIDQALAKSDVPAPVTPDTYTKIADNSVRRLEAELAKVIQLGEQSIGAALPAVGPQKHWKDYKGNLQAALALAKKNQSDEYARQWKNERAALQESIRKMRFVKVEYISQVRAYDSSTAGGGALDRQKMIASNSTSLPASAVTKGEGGESLNFATDESDLWPDEFFRLRSAAQTQCLRKSGAK